MRRKKTVITICLLLMGLLGLVGCGSPSSASVDTSLEEAESSGEFAVANGQDICGLVYESSMELQYAENFAVDYYEGGYCLLTTIVDGQRFLIVPEDEGIPENLDEDIVVLQRPMKDIYLVASAVMDMFNELISH